MARRLGLLLLALAGCPAGCLYPWDHDGTTTTGDTTGASTTHGTTSTGVGSTDADGTTADTGSGSQGSAATTDGTTTGSSGVDTTAATTGPAPFCGDGVLDLPDEECDDGDDDPNDGCDACARDRLVFATSEGFPAKNIGGLALADGICRQLAGKAGLPHWTTYSAWLSDSTHDARDRVHHGRGRYRRPDGLLVATSFDALLAGPLLAPIAADEYGDPASGGAWTGTRPDGTAVPGAGHCGDWTSDNFLDLGHYGEAAAVDEWWTLVTDPEIAPTSCASTFHVYCFEGK